MAITFGFFLDPALTTPVVSSLQFVQSVDAPVAADKTIYFGSTTAGRAGRGVDDQPITVSASGPGAAVMRLATSAEGLATAVAGADLDLPAEVLSGLAGAIVVHVRALIEPGGEPGNLAVDFVTSTIEEFVV